MEPIDFYLNGQPSTDFAARLLAGWKVQDESTDRTFVLGQKATAFTVYGAISPMKTVSLTLHIAGATPEQAARNRSRLMAVLADGIAELLLPDGFLYRAALTEMGEQKEVTADGLLLETACTLRGLRCRPLETVPDVNGVFFADGTAPFMDCRLTCTAGADAERYTMAGVTWQNVAAGDVLVLDGLEHRLLKNGASAAGDNDASDWPKLRPGENTLTAPDSLTVEYYPVFL